MSKENNVVPFPFKAQINESKKELEQPELSSEEMDEFINTLGSGIIANFREIGYDLKYSNKDIGMFMEALRSMVYRLNYKEHPFQEIAEHYFDEKTPGTLTIKASVATLMVKD